MSADKEEIRSRNDIVEVIGALVPLRRRGRNYQGLCPFHQEKTPSFYVDPSTQSFKCFGCGASGDVFTFIERYENMTFVEAAEFLARRVGLEFVRKGGERTAPSERERLFAINATAQEYFRQCLEHSQEAQEYLQERGLAKETLQQFQLGYAPDCWDGLTTYLGKQHHDLRLAATAGLLYSRRTGGGYYDVFRHRIIFPIHDEQQRIAGFGGRALGEEQPKYLNTADTPIFSKSKLLYGLPFARRKVAAEGKSLLMEGYMDVLAAHQAGFTHAVATLGTSLTEEHARKLARLVPADPVVVLVYDADSAGVKATLRASELLEQEGIQVRIACLPAGEDPDSLLKRGEIATLQKAIDQAKGRVEYQLDRIIAETDQSTETGRQLLLRKIVAILASIPSRAERDPYIGRVWRFHPMSAHSPDVAVELLHRDAEALAARRGRTSSPSLRETLTITPTTGALNPETTPPSLEGMTPPERAPQVNPAGSHHRRATSGRRPERSRPSSSMETPPSPSPGRATALERAEQELIRALAEAEWREWVLQHATSAYFVTPRGRRWFDFICTRHQRLQGATLPDLLAILEAEEDRDFSTSIRELLQELNTRMANVPITEVALEECLCRLKRYRLQLLEAQIKARIPDLRAGGEPTEQDRALVQEHQRLLRELQGLQERT
jgi:DNA primase